MIKIKFYRVVFEFGEFWESMVWRELGYYYIMCEDFREFVLFVQFCLGSWFLGFDSDFGGRVQGEVQGFFSFFFVGFVFVLCVEFLFCLVLFGLCWDCFFVGFGFVFWCRLVKVVWLFFGVFWFGVGVGGFW